MKHWLQREFLLNNLGGIIIFAEEEEEDQAVDVQLDNLRLIIHYLESFSVISKQEVVERISFLPKTRNVMTVLEEVRQEALEEGMEKGIDKGIKKGIEEGLERAIHSIFKNKPRSSDKEVARLFEMPLEKIKKMRQEYRQKIRLPTHERPRRWTTGSKKASLPAGLSVF